MQIDEDILFKLDAKEFDRDEGRIGWRLLAEDLGKDKEAAELIEEYMAVKGDNYPMLWFHAGQCWAYCGKEYVSRTIECFERSISEGDDFVWREYKLATIAYLKNDLARLKSSLIKLRNNRETSTSIERVIEFMIAQLEEDGSADYVKMYESL